MNATRERETASLELAMRLILRLFSERKLVYRERVVVERGVLESARRLKEVRRG